MAKSYMEKYLDRLDKNYGSDGLFSASSPMCSKVEVISTGSYALDDALGVWGLPRGRIAQYSGREKSGKTFMSFMAIKEWQNRDPKNWAFYIDAEGRFDPSWPPKLGLDNNRISIYRENSGVKIFERLCGIPNKERGKPKKKLGLLDEIGADGGADETGLGIVVLDSLASITPPAEEHSPSGKDNMALMGRFMPPELRRLVPLLIKSKVIFIAINQIRVKPGVMWGNPETTPGGSAWKHHCSTIVNFGMSASNEKTIFSAEDEQMGHTIIAKTDKNSCAPAPRKCEFIIEYLKGLHDPAAELRALAIKYGVVERPNNRTYVYKDQKWTSKDDFATAFLTPEEQNTLLEEIKVAKIEKLVTDAEIRQISQTEGEEEC